MRANALYTLAILNMFQNEQLDSIYVDLEFPWIATFGESFDGHQSIVTNIRFRVVLVLVLLSLKIHGKHSGSTNNVAGPNMHARTMVHRTSRLYYCMVLVRMEISCFELRLIPTVTTTLG